MSSKKTTTQHQQNSLPDWLTTPYQQATQAATNLYQSQPSLGAGTQGDINQISANADAGRSALNGSVGMLGNLASGNFGQPALTDAANGSYLASNPWANGGQPITTSSALNGFAGNGGLDTGYIDQSLLNQTANGNFLTPDSNPFIKSIANQAADAAQARTNAQFGSAGRSGGLYAQLFGQGVANAANQVYAQNYENERQRQIAAQNTLLGANQTAHEGALGRQFGAASDIFGAQNSAAENAASRASNAYEAERGRQQGAAGGLINTQLQAAAQQPGLLQAIMNGDIQSFTGHQYQDQVPYNNLAKYTGLLSTLGAPFGIQDSKTTEKTSGLGSTLGQIASVGMAVAGAMTGNPFLAMGGLSGAAGGGSPFSTAFENGGGIDFNPNQFSGFGK